MKWLCQLPANGLSPDEMDFSLQDRLILTLMRLVRIYLPEAEFGCEDTQSLQAGALPYEKMIVITLYRSLVNIKDLIT